MTILDKTFNPNGDDIDNNAYGECPYCSSNSLYRFMKDAYSYVYESLPTISSKCKKCSSE
jgi:DNA-directed RNA polymerase subunit RPC12/RpoP